MVLSALLTAILAVSGADAAAISNRDVAPGGHGYTPLGCIDYAVIGCRKNSAGSTEITLDECMVCCAERRRVFLTRQTRIPSPRMYLLTFSGRTPDGRGCCKYYRNNGPNITDWGSLPTTEDGWCATDKGVTAMDAYNEETSYVGCYENMWWYKAPYRADWGSFKPSAARQISEVAHNASKFPTFTLDKGPNTPLSGCLRDVPDEWPGIAMSPSGDCVLTNAEVGKTAPTQCTETSWRFVWKGAKPLPGDANTYGE